MPPSSGTARPARRPALGQTRILELTPKQKSRIVAVALVVQAIVATLTLRDIAKRPADRIRGPKRLWKAVGSVNTAGAAAYWLVGRKR